MKNCYAIGGRVNLNEATISLCHGIDVGDYVIWEYDSKTAFNAAYYINAVNNLRSLNQDEGSKCCGCSNLIDGEPKKEKLEIITINLMNYCQNRCVYCPNFQGEISERYDPFPIIKDLIESGMVSDNCLFDWGGGEPTLCPSFEKLFLYIHECGYMQRVNTNAIKMNDMLRAHLDKDLVSLRFSLDAGDAETFLRVKGRNLFSQVVGNIKEYRAETDNIVMKYVVNCLNSDISSTHKFVELVKDIGINTVCIDAELNSFGWQDYEGLLRFTDKELAAACELRRYAKEQGLNVQIGYVWTAQNEAVPSRDFNLINRICELNEPYEKYMIPDELLPLHKIKNSIYTHGIYAELISSMESLLYQMHGKRIFLYGAGRNGRNLLQSIRHNGLDVSGVYDKNKAGQHFDSYVVGSVSEMLKDTDDDTRIIITPFDAKSIVKEFNEKNFTELRDKLYHIEAHRYSDISMENEGLCV